MEPTPCLQMGVGVGEGGKSYAYQTWEGDRGSGAGQDYLVSEVETPKSFEMPYDLTYTTAEAEACCGFLGKTDPWESLW